MKEIVLESHDTLQLRQDPTFHQSYEVVKKMDADIPQPLFEQVENAAVDIVLSQHYRFDNEVWPYKNSFHNQDHIYGTYSTVNAIFRQKEKNEGRFSPPPYLDPYAQLERYNQQISSKYLHLKNVTIQPEELEFLMKLGFLFHDLGNIQVKNGNTLEDLDTYRRVGSEERSMEIAEHFMRTQAGFSEEDTFRYTQFIKHVIGQTVFIPDGTEVHRINEPFGVLARFIDIVGQGVMNQKKLMNMVTGLSEEEYAELGTDPVMIPSNLYGFLWKHTEELIPEENRKQIIKDIIGLEMPNRPIFKPELHEGVKRSEWNRNLRRIRPQKLQSHLIVTG